MCVENFQSFLALLSCLTTQERLGARRTRKHRKNTEIARKTQNKEKNHSHLYFGPPPQGPVDSHAPVPTNAGVHRTLFYLLCYFFVILF